MEAVYTEETLVPVYLSIRCLTTLDVNFLRNFGETLQNRDSNAFKGN